jgi:hypothetical protein
MANDTLTAYLNDHLAGSTAALELLEHMCGTASAPGDREFLTGLSGEIAEDRQTLEDIVRRVGGHQSAVRQIGGWIAEKAGRLKLMLDDPSGGALKRLESLELLALGIHGKQALWRALASVAPMVPQLADLRFLELEARAVDQHARVEARRVEAARAALADQT